jgi:hypothetical protein|tara:strand:+ start:46719 stop:47126 length:408 start_codon:yes stop_codon:yes gene_type:complete
MKIKIEISVGELLDKLSILIIKKEKINNPEKIKEIERELKFLESHALTIRSINKTEYDTFLKKLISINSKLWDIEDEIRILEKNSSFSDEFVSLARSVYFTNDERFSCKNDINIFYGSEINEVKEYVEYSNNSED